MTEPVSDPVETDFSDFFDEWIGGASPARRSVTIYGKPGLFAEFQQLQRQIDIEEAAAKSGGEEMAGSQVKKWRQRQEEIYDEWEASRTTWVLERTGEDAIEAAKSDLVEPVEPADDASDQEKAAYAQAVEEYSDEINLRLIVASVVEVRDAQGEVRQKSVTVAQLRKMATVFGQPQMLRLMAGVTEATYGDTVIPAPFSQGSSEDDPTS